MIIYRITYNTFLNQIIKTKIILIAEIFYLITLDIMMH